MSEAENEVVVPVDEPKVEAVPVKTQNASNSVVREVVADVERAVLSVEDAVRNLIALVKDHRRAGDSDVEAAMADVDAALAAKQ